MLSTILIVVLILILIGALPTWGYSGSWGYGPGGIVGTILVIVVILALSGTHLDRTNQTAIKRAAPSAARFALQHAVHQPGSFLSSSATMRFSITETAIRMGVARNVPSGPQSHVQKARDRKSASGLKVN